jgi:alkylation response protein AidB-like acyl-CoA dehydrogenase
VISLEDFEVECRAFLSEHYPRRERRPRVRFTWGVGSDDVRLFEEDDPATDAIAVAEARAWRRRLAAGDLAWITGPTRYQGRGLTPAHQAVFDQVLRDYDAPSSRLLMISLGMVAPTILAHGSDRARERYLHALHDGRLIACQLFSEPGAGSDLASVSTRAVRDGDGWRVSGQKVWTSGAHFSDIGMVLCRTGQGTRHADLTMFVIDMHGDGVDVRPLRQMTGGSAFNEVFLDAVWADDDDRLGAIGEGWRVAMTTLSHERAAIGGEGFGGVGLLSADRYVQMIRAMGLARDPMTRQRTAALIVELRVAKLTAMRAAANRRDGRAGPESSFGKLALTRNYQRISMLVSELLGPALVADTGAWGTYAWASFVLGVPGMRIGGGTDEVLLNAVAERQLGLPKEARPSDNPGVATAEARSPQPARIP